MCLTSLGRCCNMIMISCLICSEGSVADIESSTGPRWRPVDLKTTFAVSCPDRHRQGIDQGKVFQTSLSQYSEDSLCEGLVISDGAY